MKIDRLIGILSILLQRDGVTALTLTTCQALPEPIKKRRK